MRNNGDFIKDLRNEIFTTQERRHQHVRAKMLFVLALLGIGVAARPSIPETVLYLTPLIAFIFDLQILGENFGIKRAGAFIELTGSCPPEEKKWESLVGHHRDPFFPHADLLSTALVIVASAAALASSQWQSWPYYVWLLASILGVLFLLHLRKTNAGIIEKFREAVKSPESTMDSELYGLDHVQLAMPAGQEDAARAFYCGVLGFTETPKPANLAARGGAWFISGDVCVHLGVEADFRPARKAHPAFLVQDLSTFVQRCEQAGVALATDEPLDGYERVFVADPFGNRIELLQRLPATR